MFTRIVRGMVVHLDRMRENLDRSRGVVFSGTVLLELARKGVSREQAYEWVQRSAMRSFAEQRDFKALLLADADATIDEPDSIPGDAMDVGDAGDANDATSVVCQPGFHNCAGMCASDLSRDTCGPSSCLPCVSAINALSLMCNGTACVSSCSSVLGRL